MPKVLQTLALPLWSKNRHMNDTVSHKIPALASSNSRDARAIRSAAALRAALLTLLQNHPFDQITIRDICSTAGVHYATFFRHHPTKESLLDLTAREQIAKLSELAMAIRGGSDYKAGFTALCVYVEAQREVFATLLNGGAAGSMREEWVRQSMLVAEKEKHADTWLPWDLGVVCAATLMAETLAWWLNQPPGKIGVDQISAILHRLLTETLIDET